MLGDSTPIDQRDQTMIMHTKYNLIFFIIAFVCMILLFPRLRNTSSKNQYASTDAKGGLDQKMAQDNKISEVLREDTWDTSTFKNNNRPVWSIKKPRDAESLDLVINKLAGPNTRWDDPQLISVVRRLIDPPRPYVTKFSMPLIQTPQAKSIDAYLHRRTGGFFIECGALDGERSSNSIWFETKRNWTGLLVEMDPSYYMQLRGKNRKAMSINACLSPHTYPVVMPFKEHSMGQGKLASRENTSEPSIFNTYCFPFYTIMLAINVTSVDYFSLDVEGMEVPILKTIPFDRLNIKTFSVEYVHGKNGGEEYIDFMKSKGYRLHEKINYVNISQYLGVNDFIFVKD